jgi:hypothetical protein
MVTTGHAETSSAQAVHSVKCSWPYCSALRRPAPWRAGLLVDGVIAAMHRPFQPGYIRQIGQLLCRWKILQEITKAAAIRCRLPLCEAWRLLYSRASPVKIPRRRFARIPGKSFSGFRSGLPVVVAIHRQPGRIQAQ